MILCRARNSSLQRTTRTILQSRELTSLRSTRKLSVHTDYWRALSFRFRQNAARRVVFFSLRCNGAGRVLSDTKHATVAMIASTLRLLCVAYAAAAPISSTVDVVLARYDEVRARFLPFHRRPQRLPWRTRASCWRSLCVLRLTTRGTSTYAQPHTHLVGSLPVSRLAGFVLVG
jgi:hypothetical protein